MAPAIRNDTHTAAPATSPAAPSSAKIPAPTIAPTPMKAAWRTVRYFCGGAETGLSVSSIGVMSSFSRSPVVWPVSPVGRKGAGWLMWRRCPRSTGMPSSSAPAARKNGAQ